tara:strand:- start:240 stop:1136 length:897 start_codon:yes stop_codon:yes gene_type:complete
MRVTTSLFYSRASAQMSRLSDQAGALQGQIASGKKITSAADDAVAYQRLATLKQAGADDGVYKGNLSMAQGLLAQTDGALGGVQTQLQRVQELMVQANSGTLNQSQREGLAASIDSIRDDLLGLANGTDMRGQPLFGGDSGDTAFTKAADGSITFTGSATTASIPIGAQSQVQATASGASVFGGDGTAPDIFATLQSFSDALRSGDDLSTGNISSDVDAAMTNVTNVRASFAARGARVDLEVARLADVASARETTRSSLEDVDVTDAITKLQNTMTTLQAAQASFTKLSSLSLFNYLN